MCQEYRSRMPNSEESTNLRIAKFAPLSRDSEAASWLVSLGAAYQDTDKEYANAAYDYLKCGAEKWRIHVALADPAN